MSRHRAVHGVVAAALVAVLLAGVLFAAPGAGSDAISIFEYEPGQTEVEPGEEVTVDVELRGDRPTASASTG